MIIEYASRRDIILQRIYEDCATEAMLFLAGDQYLFFIFCGSGVFKMRYVKLPATPI